MRAGRSTLEEIAFFAQSVRPFSPLSRAEEHALALRAQRGDVSAKQKLIRHNLSFVLVLARKCACGVVALDDLVQEGNLGLLRALETFDPRAGTRFLTYAVWWIRSYMRKHIREARSTARRLDRSVAHRDGSLDAADAPADDVSDVEWIEDGAPGPEATCLAADQDRLVREAVARLRRRVGDLGWDIIQNRLAQDAPKTLTEIGANWGFSRERTRQIEARTLDLLRRHLASLVTDLPSRGVEVRMRPASDGAAPRRRSRSGGPVRGRGARLLRRRGTWPATARSST